MAMGWFLVVVGCCSVWAYLVDAMDCLGTPNPT
jgi:hypothetical protein